MGHGGMIEKRGAVGLTGIFQENFFGEIVFIKCAYDKNSVTVSIQIEGGEGEGDGEAGTGSQSIQLAHHVPLVLRPSDIKAFWRKQAWNTVVSVFTSMWYQIRHVMKMPSLRP